MSIRQSSQANTIGSGKYLGKQRGRTTRFKSEFGDEKTRSSNNEQAKTNSSDAFFHVHLNNTTNASAITPSNTVAAPAMTSFLRLLSSSGGSGVFPFSR